MAKNKNMEGSFSGDPSEMRKKPDEVNAVPGVNTPNIEVPAFNPPVPNRAWTEMKKDVSCDKTKSKNFKTKNQDGDIID